MCGNKLEHDEQGGMVSKRMLERYIEPCSMLEFYFALPLLGVGWGEECIWIRGFIQRSNKFPLRFFKKKSSCTLYIDWLLYHGLFDLSIYTQAFSSLTGSIFSLSEHISHSTL